HRTVLAHRSCAPFLHTVPAHRSSTPFLHAVPSHCSDGRGALRLRRVLRLAILPCRSTLPFRYAVSPCGPRGAWGCLGTKLDRVVGPPGDRWGSAGGALGRGGGRGARP